MRSLIPAPRPRAARPAACLALAWPALLAACSGDPGPADPGADPADTSPADTAPPPLTAAEAEAAIQGALQQAGLPDPMAMLDAFRRMIDTGRDSQCPRNMNYSLNESFSGCTTASGYTFAGVSAFQPLGQGDRDFFLLGDCFFYDPQGQRLECAGELEFEEDQGAGTFSGKLTGTWGYPPEPIWIGMTPGMALWMEGGRSELHLEGAYAPGDADLYFHGASYSGGCSAGAISVRAEGGGWCRMDLGCDGCGPITCGEAGREVLIGEGCSGFNTAATAVLGRLGWG